MLMSHEALELVAAHWLSASAVIFATATFSLLLSLYSDLLLARARSAVMEQRLGNIECLLANVLERLQGFQCPMLGRTPQSNPTFAEARCGFNRLQEFAERQRPSQFQDPASTSIRVQGTMATSVSENSKKSSSSLRGSLSRQRPSPFQDPASIRVQGTMSSMATSVSVNSKKDCFSRLTNSLQKQPSSQYSLASTIIAENSMPFNPSGSPPSLRRRHEDRSVFDINNAVRMKLPELGKTAFRSCRSPDEINDKVSFLMKHGPHNSSNRSARNARMQTFIAALTSDESDAGEENAPDTGPRTRIRRSCTATRASFAHVASWQARGSLGHDKSAPR